MMNTAMPRSTPSSGADSGSAGPSPAPGLDHSPTIHVVRRVTRIQPTGVRAERPA